MKKYIPYIIALLLIAGGLLIYKLANRDPVKRILSQATSLKQFQEELASKDLGNPGSKVFTEKGAIGFVEEKPIEFPDEKLGALYSQGVEAFDAGNFKNCVDFLLPITKTFNHPYVYSKIGEAWMNLEKYDDAINLNHKFSDAYLNKGYCLGKLNKHSAAIESADLAIHYDSTSFMAYYNRGLSRWNNQDVAPVHRRDYLKAVDDFTLSIQYQPVESDFDSAYYSRGLAYINLGILDKALPDMEMAIKINPDRADAYFFKGICHFYREQYEDALPLFAKAQEKGSTQKELLSYLDWTEKIVEERKKSDQAKNDS